MTYSFSIITPFSNATKYYQPYVNSLLSASSHCNLSFEILLVDNNIDSPSIDEDLLQLIAKIPNSILLKYTEVASSYAARNFGASHASAPILCFIDIDCIFTSDWFNSISSFPLEYLNYIVCGMIQTYSPEITPSSIYDDLNFLNISYYRCNPLGQTANLLCPRYIFKACGGFNQVESGADIQFCKRAIETGYGTKLVKSFVILHPLRTSISAVFSKLKRVASGQIPSSRLSKLRALIKNLLLALTNLDLLRFLILLSRSQYLFTSSYLMIFNSFLHAAFFSLYFRLRRTYVLAQALLK